MEQPLSSRPSLRTILVVLVLALALAMRRTGTIGSASQLTTGALLVVRRWCAG
jgi:hypothetical protein